MAKFGGKGNEEEAVAAEEAYEDDDVCWLGRL